MTGSSFDASQSITKLEPMKPAPPVTRIMLLPYFFNNYFGELTLYFNGATPLS
jgi:hypothetical protein